MKLITAAFAVAAWSVDAKDLKGLTNPVPAKDRAASAERGKKIYAAQCARCHGASGKGDGEDGMYYTTKPANFSDAAFAKESDGEVFYKITKGRGDMPAFATSLKDLERWDSVNFLRTLK